MAAAPTAATAAAAVGTKRRSEAARDARRQVAARTDHIAQSSLILSNTGQK
jgi:hypothetical protein